MKKLKKKNFLISFLTKQIVGIFDTIIKTCVVIFVLLFLMYSCIQSL